jgi:hypothetical protein
MVQQRDPTYNYLDKLEVAEVNLDLLEIFDRVYGCLNFIEAGGLKITSIILDQP